MKVEEITMGSEKLLRWTVGASVFIACPQRGGRLLNWYIQMPDGSMRDIVYWPSNRYEDIGAIERGGNRICFPFLGPVSHRGELGLWETPDSRVCSMPTDGFAHDASFEILNFNEKGATLRLDPKRPEVYPYNCSLTLNYRFNELSVSLEMQLENHETFPIPWGAGQRWYLHIPWHAELSLKDYNTDITAKKIYRQTENGSCLPYEKTGRGPTPLDTFEMYHLIHSKVKSQSIAIGPKSGEENIHFICHTSPTADIQFGMRSLPDGCCCFEPRLGCVEEPQQWVPSLRSASFSCELSLL